MKNLDLPPVWLFVALFSVWGLSWVLPATTVHWGWLVPAAWVLVALGLLLAALALVEMRKARTTFIPRREASALVTVGVFQWSRNPIYLGDVLFLTAGVLGWGSVLGLPLIWVFIQVIEKRFIDDEEAALRSKFPKEFEAWTKTTRRWI